MKGFLKFLIFVGILLVIAGGILFGFAIGTRAFEKEEMKTNVHEISEVIENININVETADLELKMSTDGKTKVECIEKEKTYHEVKVENNTLNIQFVNNLRWYQKVFNFDFRKITVTLYLTETSYNKLQILSSTGNVIINKEFSFDTANVAASTGNVSFLGTVKNKADLSASTGNVKAFNLGELNTLNLKTSTGNINAENINATNFTANSSTGNITLSSVIAKDKIDLRASTGNIKFSDCDSNTLFIRTSTGDIFGTLLTGKVFKTTKTTGTSYIPTDDPTKGECKIETSTGNIRIDIK